MAHEDKIIKKMKNQPHGIRMKAIKPYLELPYNILI
jgi:hypothetical protein